ncbi:MAG: hypothetical protein V4539_20180 [Bacteroidota bacterium]
MIKLKVFPEKIIAELDKQITQHETILANLRAARASWIDFKEPLPQVIPDNPTLTRELVLELITGFGEPMQTAQIIELLYGNKSDEERYYLTRHLAVMLNQMVKAGKLKTEKKSGVKGNFFY